VAELEFRRSIQEHLDRIDREMGDMRHQQDELAKQLTANTLAVTKLTNLIAAGEIGTGVIKYLIGIGTAIIVAYAAFKGIKN
jgi:hypothetical protein